jgi:hypothetical protein
MGGMTKLIRLCGTSVREKTNMPKKTKKKAKKKAHLETVLGTMRSGLSKFYKEDPKRKSYITSVKQRYVENPAEVDFVDRVEDDILNVLSWYDEYVYQNDLVWSFENLAGFVFVKLEKNYPDYEIDEEWVLDTIENVLYKAGYTDVRPN